MLVSGVIVDKPARLVAAGEPIELRRRSPFVSRGGHKLAYALDHFDVHVGGRRCLDAGASTGGFTDCLLQRGAAEVVAVDVGRGQLASSLRGDARVRVLEGVNARYLTTDAVGGAVELATADLSFISLRLVAPALRGVLVAGGEGVFLIKPQFEAERREIARGGVVREPSVHRRVLEDVVESLAAEDLGALGVVASPLRGPAGNVEFLGHFAAGGEHGLEDAAITEAVETAGATGR